MNSDLRACMKSAAEFAEAYAGESFSIGAKQYQGIFANASVSAQALQGGYTATFDCTLLATKAQFSARPVARGTVIRNGSSLIVRSVDEDETHYIFQLSNG